MEWRNASDYSAEFGRSSQEGGARESFVQVAAEANCFDRALSHSKS
jgi:hypothetical protein